MLAISPMQLYIRAGLSLPAQGSFFLVCAGDSVGVGYSPCIMPRPVHLKVLYVMHFSITKKLYQNVLLLQFCQTSMMSIGVIATLFVIKKLTFSFRLHDDNF